MNFLKRLGTAAGIVGAMVIQFRIRLSKTERLEWPLEIKNINYLTFVENKNIIHRKL